MPSQIRYGEKTLEKTVTRLQKFCHVDHITEDFYDVCPDSCGHCEAPPDLDLHTSLAWVLASEIEGFLEQMESFNIELGEFYDFYENLRGCEITWMKRDEWNEMESSLIDIQSAFDELNDAYRGAIILRASLNYHAEKYMKLWGYVSTGTSIMRTAWSNCKSAVKRCKTILRETNKRLEKLEE